MDRVRLDAYIAGMAAQRDFFMARELAAMSDLAALREESAQRQAQIDNLNGLLATKTSEADRLLVAVAALTRELERVKDESLSRRLCSAEPAAGPLESPMSDAA